MRDRNDHDSKETRLEVAARGASGMLRIALRGDAEGTLSKRQLLEIMTGAAKLLERALAESDRASHAPARTG